MLGGGLVEGSAILIGGDPGIGKSTLVLQAGAALARRRRAGRLCQRRGVDRPDPAARRAARPRRGAAAARRGDLGRRRDRDLRPRRRAAPGDHRFDPDHVCRGHRVRAGHGHPAAHQRARADPLRQAARRRAVPGRPRHQGRPDRRAPRCSSTWSTRCSISRASAATSSASCARSRTASAPPTRSACSRWASEGLAEVRNPSALFLAEREAGVSGAAVFAGMEGSRPLAGRDPGAGRGLRRSAARAAPWSAGTRAGSRCCWPCSRRAAGLPSAGATSI